MQLEFNGYNLNTKCGKCKDNRYFVCVIIDKEINGETRTAKYFDTSNTYTLEVEAEKESINFGKNLIKQGIVSL